MNVPVTLLAENEPKDLLPFNVTPDSLRKQKKNVYVLTNNSSLFPEDILKDADEVLGDLDGFSEEKIRDSAFYIYFNRGDYALPFLAQIVKAGGVFVSPHYYAKVPCWQNSRWCIDIYNEIAVRLKHTPKGSVSEMASIMQAIDATAELEGDYVEIGVYSGTSALAALLYMQRRKIRRRTWLLDTYEGFAYEEAKKSQDIKWFGRLSTWGNINLSGNAGISRIKNLTQGLGEVLPRQFNACTDNLPGEIRRIAMANLDVDMYEATLISLQKLAPLIIPGGIITTEDPAATWGLYGAYLALHEFLASEAGRNFISIRTETTYMLIKKN